ncbi:MAG TPA: hypothetical protein VLM89_14255 [Phycisphaerae bacterium]|nr:hypothetical protein [Phycisphaerae bacterium]
MTRKRSYPIIRFLIRSFYGLGILMLLGGVGLAVYAWLRAEALRDGIILGGPLADVLHKNTSSELYLLAAALAAIGLVGFLLFGAVGQILAMHRDRAIDSALQVLLLEDILELNEEAAKSSHRGRVDLCDGCGRLGAIQAIESGQWVCRECRRQMREA